MKMKTDELIAGLVFYFACAVFTTSPAWLMWVALYTRGLL